MLTQETCSSARRRWSTYLAGDPTAFQRNRWFFKLSASSRHLRATYKRR